MGTFKNYTQGSSISDCKTCTPGMYCKSNGQAVPSGLCDGGWYCSGGSVSKTPTQNSTGRYTFQDFKHSSCSCLCIYICMFLYIFLTLETAVLLLMMTLARAETFFYDLHCRSVKAIWSHECRSTLYAVEMK